MDTKTCSKCGVDKDPVEFYSYAAACKECTRARVRAYKKANPGRVADSKRLSYQKNIEKCKARSKSNYWSDPEKHRAASKAWRKANPEKARENRRKQKKYPAGISATARYREKHRDRLLKRERYRMRAGARELSDAYVAATICAHGSPLRAACIPPALVEAKRVHLQIHRLLRDLTK